MTTDDTHKVFVYGTLKRGYDLHHMMDNSIRIGNAITERGFVLLSLDGIPYMARVSNMPTKVVGEVYEVTPERLRSLDWLERGYIRTPIQVFLEDDTPLEVDAYLHEIAASNPAAYIIRHMQNSPYLELENDRIRYLCVHPQGPTQNLH